MIDLLSTWLALFVLAASCVFFAVLTCFFIFIFGAHDD